MALGITKVTTSYNTVDDKCIMSSIAEYTAESAGWHTIFECTPGAQDCYPMTDEFEIKAGDSLSGELDLFDTEVGQYHQVGDKIDITLMEFPYTFPGDMVGMQQEIVLEECGTLCTPGDRICKGNYVYECNPSGTAHDVLIEYCPDGCIDGACIEDECTPGDRICKGNDIYECNTSGSAYDKYVKTCPTGTHCSNGTCVEDDDPLFGTDITTLAAGAVGVAAIIIIAKELIQK